ncbi:MAG: NAD(P)/FAD-dependent oxidoreductase [Flavobacteriales bacterium]|nr:NAD(P)/FAD-dependent oxidoreductase [Flavobacteriales bacterium]
MSKITRRDFINGTLMAAGATMLPIGCTNDAVINKLDPLYYPPALTGLRGSHAGSNTHAHARAWSQKSDWGSTSKLNETYDLVVVGGGLSGLAAAYFYQEKHGKDKKTLILDNHDDFGGHAKRNEHTVDGTFLLAHGGSQSIVEPKLASAEVNRLFKEVGVFPERFETAYDHVFFKKNNLGAVTYFNKKVFGEDKIVKHPFCNYPNYVQGIIMRGKTTNEEAAQQAPLSETGKEQLLRVLNGGLHVLDVPENEMEQYQQNNSYFDYLKNTLGVNDPGVLRMARHSALDWGTKGADIMSLQEAIVAGAMGFKIRDVYDENNKYIYHYPDGNAGIARAIVKHLIPEVAKGNNAEELVLAKFKYAELDKPNNTTRIRLNSTVINVQHIGDSKDAEQVGVKYMQDDKAYEVKGNNVIMACYNMMVPHIVPNLPAEQAKALSKQNKSVVIYTSVGVKNWKAMKELEIGMAMSPGNMFQTVYMDFPISVGEYDYTKTTDAPCIIQMISCPYGETVGAPRDEQIREARHKMLSLKFEDYEAEIRAHLTGMFPKELFDFDRDVESITINRWAHGYPAPGPAGSLEKARQPFGRITIANADCSGIPDLKNAMDEAYRAVSELG